MSELKIEGKLYKILETQEVSSSFRKREFILETDEQYPQLIKLELTQTKCDDINGYNVGDQITVHFNVRGREWINKEGNPVYFLTLQAWRLEKLGGGGSAGNQSGSFASSKKETSTTESPFDSTEDSGSDDLPF